jgi:uncharacterized lipoprotein YmbA
MSRRPLVLVLACAALAACSVKAPVRQVWTLVAREPGASARTANPAGPALGVTRFTATPELRSTDLQYREAGGHLIHQTDDQWADYPDRMLEEMTLDALGASGGFSKVVPTPPRTGVDQVLSARLVEFTEWHDGEAEARVALRWTLTNVGGAALASGTASATVPVPQRSLQSVVQAYADAANQAIAQLVTDVRAATP